MSRTRFEASLEKRAAVDAADPECADSLAVRERLLGEWKRGEKTLPQIQAELEAIKRAAKKAGKLTRTQVWNRA